MSKILIKVLIVFASLIALSACDLDHTGTYSYANRLQFNFKDEKVQDAIVEYIENTIPNKDIDSFYGSQYDAVVNGIEKFNENIKALDFDVIESMLVNEGDFAQYSMTISSEKYADIIGYYGWIKEAEKPEEGDK